MSDSLRICIETVGWVRRSASAARVKPPVCTTMSKICSWRMVIDWMNRLVPLCPCAAAAIAPALAAPPFPAFAPAPLPIDQSLC